jgi:hypothetical protein
VALTDAGIRAIEAPAKRIQKADGNACRWTLCLAEKIWLFRYRLKGQYGRVSLGRYLDLRLKAARKKRDELAVKVANGIDPAGRKRGDEPGFTVDSTVEEFGQRYYTEQVVKLWKKPEHVRRYLDNDIYPALAANSSRRSRR